MARYEHLPIYKQAFDLAVYLQNTVRQFSRYDKYSVGADLRDLSRSILRLVIRANSRRDKEAPLAELVECCEELKTMLVFAKETKAFQNFKSFQHAATVAASLCRQSEGWLGSSKRPESSTASPGAGR